MDSIKVERHHRLAAGAQFDGQRIEQPESLAEQCGDGWSVSSFTSRHFVEVVLNSPRSRDLPVSVDSGLGFSSGFGLRLPGSCSAGPFSVSRPAILSIREEEKCP